MQEAIEATGPAAHLRAQQWPLLVSVVRYMEGWSKNPFTIKTAPVAITRISFAENLAIGSYYGSKDDPTIIIVNTKTGERTQLKSGVASASGMELKSVTIMPRRRDTTAEVTREGEVATLQFDDAYLRQVAVNRSAPTEPTAADPAIPHAGPPAGSGAASPPAKVRWGEVCHPGLAQTFEAAPAPAFRACNDEHYSPASRPRAPL